LSESEKETNGLSGEILVIEALTSNIGYTIKRGFDNHELFGDIVDGVYRVFTVHGMIILKEF